LGRGLGGLRVWRRIWGLSCLVVVVVLAVLGIVIEE
jgi:hypothetical protein